ncbi:hypothetical protein GDO86_020628 [Hymenochirus boettgeri]|uniref:N-acetyltransferase domain-containing protein n=1 Tax=Hymenochirus boettgeri TaxID=247094 RepID=A0A8T2IKL1_9PIPI|nr:hypothetical protein GDO86_020628 [Hymenochirus boettgeri]
MSVSPLLDVQILQATADDYDEVMSISVGIYKGMDYLPAMYHRWLADPKRSMFVAKSEGKVVGFGSFLLVDNGVTALLQAMRVAPWRQIGYIQSIATVLFDHLQASSCFLSLGTPLFTVPLAEHMYQVKIDLFGTDPSLAQTHILHQLRVTVGSLPLGGSIVCRVSAEMCQLQICGKGRPS